MADRCSLRVPSYRQHKQSGQAIVTLTDGFGGRRDVLLGEHGSKPSRVEYARVIAEWEAAGRRLPGSELASDLTINELILAYWRHVEHDYRTSNDSPSRTLDNIRDAMRPLRQLYGDAQARTFG